MKRRMLIWILLVGGASPLLGQSGFPVSLSWPTADKPTIKFTIAKLQPAGLYNGQSIFVSEVSAQNLSDQPIPKAIFTVFINDKDNVRIGRGLLRFSEMLPMQPVKAQLQFSTAGVPAGATLLNGRTVALKIVSVPPGASFKIDGQDGGTTPRVADFAVGMHTIVLNKEGYAAASSPLEVTGDETDGGAVTFEMGGLSNDFVQLRDGTTLLGDVISLSLTSAVVRVDGKEQKYDRNQIKKIVLVERVATQSPVIQHEAAKPK